MPTSKVSGTITGPDGAVGNLQVTLVPAEADVNATSIEMISGFSDGQGKFAIEGVPPGNYIMRATRMPMSGGRQMMAFTVNGGAMTVVENRALPAAAPNAPAQTTLWGEMPVAVGNKDLDGVAFSMRVGAKMTGSIQFNGAAEKPTPQQMQQGIGIVLEPADPKPGVRNGDGRIEQNGTFTTTGMPAGRYFVRVKAGLQGWALQSAIVGGRDASVVPVDLDANDLSGVVITFTDKPTELTGQVAGDGQLEGMGVVIFPVDQTAWTGYGSQSRRLAATRADKKGAFSVKGLPAGDYNAIAMPDKMLNDWSNPKFLQSIAGQATRVHVSDGSKANVSLQVIK